MAVTQIADVIVPSRFAQYVQVLTTIRSRLIQSGAMTVDAALSALLAGGGSAFNSPSWKDLPDDADNVSSDDDTTKSVPNKIQSLEEIQVRLSRNGHWSDMDLANALAGSDAGDAIATRVAEWWVRRMQDIFVSTWTGIFADNDAAPSGGDTHTINDLTNDIKGVSYVAGVTDFSADAMLDSLETMGDSHDDLSMICTHSKVVTNMKKKNIIVEDTPDSDGKVNFRTYLGHTVIMDNRVPSSGGVYETWFFGPGSTRLGEATPKVPAAVTRDEDAGNGGGQEHLHSRRSLIMHPSGHAYIGAATQGGPANSVLDDAASWSRRFPERNQIKVARLVTREHA